MYVRAAPEVRPPSIFIGPVVGAFVAATPAECLSFVSLCAHALFFSFCSAACVCVTRLEHTAVSHLGRPRFRSGCAD